eukprot:9499289-Pyramimonas_sp.AAC.1
MRALPVSLRCRSCVAPTGAMKPARGAPKWLRYSCVDTAAGAFGGTPCGDKKRARGAQHWLRCRRSDAATGAFCGAPYEATKRAK